MRLYPQATGELLAMRSVVVTGLPAGRPRRRWTGWPGSAWPRCTRRSAASATSVPGSGRCTWASRIGGTAVTALCWPGDNLMIHAAVEQCAPGDMLVVTTTSPSTDGVFGELLATVAAAPRRARPGHHRRGAGRGRTARDGLPGVLRRGVGAGHGQGHGGRGQRAGRHRRAAHAPGDVILADDDGVVVVPRAAVGQALAAARARAGQEEAARAAFAGGELGLDRYGLRAVLAGLGVEYVDYQASRTLTVTGAGSEAATGHPVHADAGRHLEGPVLPRVGPAGRPERAGRAAAGGDGQRPSAADRRARRRRIR